ncbi:MAG: aldo/keto reductase, partial [Myxococcota bacterium]|nr:aldo/keto reductase [Myxococcota bacterium]
IDSVAFAGGALGLAREEARGRPGGARLAAVIEVLDRLAAREGASRAAVALAFVGVHPAGPIPIVGSQRPERIRDAATATQVRLSRSDWYDVVEASRGTPLP